jgi:hypothetical protein
MDPIMRLDQWYMNILRRFQGMDPWLSASIRNYCDVFFKGYLTEFPENTEMKYIFSSAVERLGRRKPPCASRKSKAVVSSFNGINRDRFAQL